RLDTLPLHDALPIYAHDADRGAPQAEGILVAARHFADPEEAREGIEAIREGQERAREIGRNIVARKARPVVGADGLGNGPGFPRSEEHTSELQSREK